MAKIKKGSKRQTLSQKYNIQKKVREHKRKVRKELRNTNSPFRKKFTKDPGIPNSYPFKAQLLADLDRRRKEKDLQIRMEKNNQNNEEADELIQVEAAQKNVAISAEQEKLYKLLQDAQMRQDAFMDTRKNGRKENIAFDNIRKRYTKELCSVLQQADVIIHVVDARNPILHRNADLEEFMLRAQESTSTSQGDTKKRYIIVLNKIDLVPTENLKMWLTYLNRLHKVPILCCKCAVSHSKAQNTFSKYLDTDPLIAKDSTKRSSSHILGVSSLLRLLKTIAYADGVSPSADDNANEMHVDGTEASAPGNSNKRVKSHITVGIVGCPNVGKSSIINALTKSGKSALVAANPGSTRTLNYIRLDKHIELIDSPGVIYIQNFTQMPMLVPPQSCLLLSHDQNRVQGTPEGENSMDCSNKINDAIKGMMMVNMYQPSQIPDTETVASSLISVSCMKTLQYLYSIGMYYTPREMLVHLSKRHGKLKKGGVPDLHGAAVMFLTDWKNGKIPYYTAPIDSGIQNDEISIQLDGDNNQELSQMYKELLKSQVDFLCDSNTTHVSENKSSVNGLTSKTSQLRLLFADRQQRKNTSDMAGYEDSHAKKAKKMKIPDDNSQMLVD